MNSPPEVAVVGAGIVGLSCALWLRKKGFAVTVIDPEPPGSGTSSGNACTIAEYACIPVNNPSLFHQLPAMLMTADSPLRISPKYLLQRPAWALEFLVNCRRSRVDRIVAALGGLLARTREGMDPLLDEADARGLLEERGMIHLFRDRREFDAYRPTIRRRREQGVVLREIGADEIRDLEPALKPIFRHGMWFEGTQQVHDPLRLCQAYAAALQHAGGTILQRRVAALAARENGVDLFVDGGERLRAACVVVAAGARSRFIDGTARFLRKLDTERGYHLMYRDCAALLSRPVSWQAAGFYAVPMALGLRLAGTVEIAGLDAPANPRVTAYIARKGREMLDLPPRADSDWLGFRPTFPDSLPVIGAAAGEGRILYACGHQHVGLTLAGITGKLIAELANGERASHNMAPFSADRFH